MRPGHILRSGKKLPPSSYDPTLFRNLRLLMYTFFFWLKYNKVTLLPNLCGTLLRDHSIILLACIRSRINSTCRPRSSSSLPLSTRTAHSIVGKVRRGRMSRRISQYSRERILRFYRLIARDRSSLWLRSQILSHVRGSAFCNQLLEL